MEGQLYPDERKFLFDAVYKARPRLVLEIGTWKGGGSTWQIAMALAELRGEGHACEFHTCETNQSFYAQATSIYQQPQWAGFVHCHNVLSSDLIAQLLAAKQIPDFVFFDGAEDPDQNYDDFVALDAHLGPNARFCMHDWDLGPRIDGGESTKAARLRPYLMSSTTWNVVALLTAPISVGLVLAVKR